jgi:hypothetical protein
MYYRGTSLGQIQGTEHLYCAQHSALSLERNVGSKKARDAAKKKEEAAITFSNEPCSWGVEEALELIRSVNSLVSTGKIRSSQKTLMSLQKSLFIE